MKPIGETGLAVVDVSSRMTNMFHMKFAVAMHEAMPGSRAANLCLVAAIGFLVGGPAIVPVGFSTVAINGKLLVDGDVLVDDLWWQMHLPWHNFGVVDGLGVIDGVGVRASNFGLPAAVEALGMRPNVLPAVQAFFAIIRV